MNFFIYLFILKKIQNVTKNEIKSAYKSNIIRYYTNPEKYAIIKSAKTKVVKPPIFTTI